MLRKPADLTGTSWKHLEEFLKTSSNNVFETLWRQIWSILKTSLQDILKRSSRSVPKVSKFVLVKTFWRRLQDLNTKTYKYLLGKFYIVKHDGIVNKFTICFNLVTILIFDLYNTLLPSFLVQVDGLLNLSS